MADEDESQAGGDGPVEDPRDDAVDEPLDDPRAPLWLRLSGFVGVLAFLALLASVVMIRDRHRDDQAGRADRAPQTVVLPVENGGSMRVTTQVPTPPGSGPDTLPRGPRTNNEVALSLEAALKRDSGWTHKVSCLPGGSVTKGTVLECHAASEPPIREAPPGTIFAVVIDGEGRFVWAARPDESYTVAALTADPGLSCEALVQRGYPFVVALAYWEANGRPALLDPGSSGSPCSDQYSAADIDSAFSRAR